MKRKIIQIDEEKCNGCGACTHVCAEAALEMVDGKAKVVDEALCDGAGFCLPVCPTGALSLEMREAPDFDEARAEIIMHERPPTFIAQKCFRCNSGEEQSYLIPIRHQAKSLWVCTHCLPALIHG